jgi:MerR family transcriptional regulator/heat shock protein HspR
MTENPESDTARGVFGMSVAAELVGLDPQSLRLYERRGLIQPHRTSGGTRRYSPDDLDRLRRIKALLAAGLNLAGIVMVLDLEADNDLLRTQVRDEDASLDDTR